MYAKNRCNSLWSLSKQNQLQTDLSSKAGANFYRPLMSLGGEKVFAHLSWKQSKKSAFGEIIFHSFPVFGLFKRGRKCVVGNWQEWPNASNCWWGNWNLRCRINVDNPIEFPSWQELANHQLLWKYKKNTKIKFCQSLFCVCYLIQKFVSICWMIFWSWRMSSIAIVWKVFAAYFW